MDPRYEFLLQSDITERARAQFRKEGISRPAHLMRAYLDLPPEPLHGEGNEERGGEEGGEV